jgi:hypothetical protein
MSDEKQLQDAEREPEELRTKTEPEATAWFDPLTGEWNDGAPPDSKAQPDSAPETEQRAPEFTDPVSG